MNEKNLIYLIFILIVFLFPPLMKLLTGKKLGGRRVERNDNVGEEEIPSSNQPELPGTPKTISAEEGMNFESHSVSSNEPIKPKMF